MTPEEPFRSLPPADPALAGRRMLPAPVRWLLLALAVASLALGIVGIFLPGLPTVPFVLLAAWAASLSSPKLSRWLSAHPRFGEPLNAWRQHGVVRRRAKWTASIAMLASAVTTLVLLHSRWPAWLAVICMGVVLLWLWQRPEHGVE